MNMINENTTSTEQTKMKNKISTIIYNCKTCKKVLRVEYPIEKAKGYFYRRDANDKLIPNSCWVKRWNADGTRLFDGDIEKGLCASCGAFMSSGELKGFFNADVKCSARCTNARGNNCECSCGGLNHGAN